MDPASWWLLGMIAAGTAAAVYQIVCAIFGTC